MSKLPIEYLRHILEECEFILSTTASMSGKDDLLNNELVKRAVVRSLGIIGEATKKIPIDLKQRWNQIPWKNIAGMRDKLVHDYFGVNYSIVWDVVRNKIPGVKEQIVHIIDFEENKSK